MNDVDKQAERHACGREGFHQASGAPAPRPWSGTLNSSQDSSTALRNKSMKENTTTEQKQFRPKAAQLVLARIHLLPYLFWSG